MEEEAEPMREWGPWPWIIGTTCFIGFMLFAAGWNYIDSSEPDTNGATTLYLMTMFFGLGVVAVAYVMRTFTNHGAPAIGLFLALVGGATFASLAADSYWWGLDFAMLIFMLPAIVVGYGLTLAIMGAMRGKDGMADACTTWGIAVAGSAAVAAAYHLSTIQHQAQRALEAHESPGFALVGLAAALLAAYAIRSK